MLLLCHTFAFLRSKIVPLMLGVFAASFAMGQNSFMMHYAPSALDGYLVSRGDFNNDGIPDIVVGNNAGTGGYGISMLLGKDFVVKSVRRERKEFLRVAKHHGPIGFTNLLYPMSS